MVQQLQGLGAPINYYDMIPDFRREALMETQNRVGQQAVISSQMDNQQQQQEQQRRGQFYDAMLNAKPEELPGLRQKYPEFVQNIQQEIGIQGAEHAAFVNSALNNLSTASASGNPQQVMQAIQQSAPALASINVSPQDAMQLYQDDPARFNNLLIAARLGTLPVDKQFDVQQNQQKIDETIRNNRAGEGLQAQSNGIAQQNVNVRRLELQDKALDRQIARETNQVQLGVLQDKRDATQRELEQARTDKVDTYNTSMDTMARTVDTANKVLSSPGFTGYFGTNINPLSSRFIPGTDAADTSALVDTLKSQGFISGIQQMRGMGSLSNAEGQKLMDAIGNLSSSQSENSAKAAIKTIIDTTQMAQKRMQQKYGKSIPAPQASQPQSQLSDDELVNKYLGGK
ncbi:acyltransferase [Yersinia enterocolitica]|nr:acyltransferase [Yersinia enterocolitica]HEN3621586.1 phage DNA ejection protein [Yersinia enterocolitica]